MTEEFNPFTLKGKNIVVTGASSGIGRQCAIDFSRMGANVVLIARNCERLTETFTCLCKSREHRIIVSDLTEFETLPLKIEEAVKSIGKIDGLVNCAGVSTTLPLQLMHPAKIEEFFKVNVISAITLTREITRRKNMNDGGSVIFISSVMGYVGESGKSLYGMTKGALIAASRSLACEYSRRKIRFNCVSPGAILTPINENLPHMRDPEQRNQLEDRHLLGLGRTADVSSACIYLLSDAARWITGQNLIVDGGYTVR